MCSHGFQTKERPLVKHVADLELAYVHQRYKEVHDFLHVLLGFGVDPASELAVKWFEMVQTGLPGTALSAFAGPLMLSGASLVRLNVEYLPLVLSNAFNAEFFMNLYVEEHMAEDIVSSIQTDCAQEANACEASGELLMNKMDENFSLDALFTSKDYQLDTFSHNGVSQDILSLHAASTDYDLTG